MSQETQIGNLSGGISDEDSRLVDSILNDINSSGAQQQQQQQQLAQQQASVQQKMNLIQQGAGGDIMESVKLEAKNIMTVVFLCILFNIEQVDNLLKGVTMFVSEGGGLNMQAVFLKSILIGLIFYLVKTYLL
jgi:hypothetical protein